jgi:hypothetical protein
MAACPSPDAAGRTGCSGGGGVAPFDRDGEPNVKPAKNIERRNRRDNRSEEFVFMDLIGEKQMEKGNQPS